MKKEYEPVDWVNKLQNATPIQKEFLRYFFEPTIIKDFSQKDVEKFIKVIDEDVAIKVNSFRTLFHVGEVEDQQGNTYYKSSGKLSESQFNSKSHQMFLKLIGKYYGKPALNLLKERKNISIFNIQEIHVLNKKIFDNLGEEFVNTILNYEIKGASTTIANMLNDDNKMKNFKCFYNLYQKLIVKNPHDYATMFEKFDFYEPLIESVIENKGKLSKGQKETLKQVLNDSKNTYNIKDINDLNEYYNLKNKWFEHEIQKSKNLEEQKVVIFTRLFNVGYMEKGLEYSANLSSNIRNLIDNFDIQEFMDKHHGVDLSEYEKKILNDIQKLANSKTQDEMWKIFNENSKDTKLALATQDLLNKIPYSFNHSFNQSVTKVDSLKESCKKNEEGVKASNQEGIPVYTLEGKNFAFLSTTILEHGWSGNSLGKNLADAWFTYEQGTSHICSSYVAATDTENCFKSWSFIPDKGGVSLVFDEFQILGMDTRDITTQNASRRPELMASITQFSYNDKFINKQGENGDEKSKNSRYNEVAINRYSLNGSKDIRFGGKIIPSAILCDSKVTDAHIETAKQFTEFLVTNGLKPKDYQMPIIVVNKEKYIEKQNNRRKETIKEEFATKDKVVLEEEKIEQKIEQEKKVITISKGR